MSGPDRRVPHGGMIGKPFQGAGSRGNVRPILKARKNEKTMHPVYDVDVSFSDSALAAFATGEIGKPRSVVRN